MMNLLGCKKEDFYKLLGLMCYKPKKIKDSEEEFFVYKPINKKIRMNKISKEIKENSPFEKLSELRFR